MTFSWASLASLGAALVRLLTALGIYKAGKSVARGEIAEAEADARQRQAKAAADVGGLDIDGLAERVRDKGY